MAPWIDRIRKNANATNHEIPSPSRDRAESTVMFTAQLLRTVYEMDYLAESHNLTAEQAEIDDTVR